MIELINCLSMLCVDNNLISTQDVIYCNNQISKILQKEKVFGISSSYTLKDVLEELYKQSHFDNVEYFESTIMNIYTKHPSEIIRLFNSQNIISATSWFYKTMQNNLYIKMTEINKNKKFDYVSKYGILKITINLAKPEKDPQDILKAIEKESTDYPKCVLCPENEGYYKGRDNIRLIPLKLNNEDWFFQYSPYVYYNEHAIVLSKEHKPMIINKNTLKKLLDFVDQFPHYFIGSNADIPLVGGSILNHEHFQGGKSEFPMNFAETIYNFNVAGVEMGILNWPLSVIRIKSTSKEKILNISNHILEKWKAFNTKKINSQNNGLAPVLRKNNTTYIFDLILRNNETSLEYPDGIYHPHKDVHHIKKENIGLIEVLGLAILPARLLKEIEYIHKYYIDKTKHECIKKHFPWLDEIENDYHNAIDKEHFLENEIGKKFEKGLEDACVFKKQEEFIEFINTL